MNTMKLTLCIMLAGLAGPLLGQDAPADQPEITSELREAYFHAKSDTLEAQLVLEAAQKRLDAAVKAMQAICPLVVDADGKPQCAAPVEKEPVGASE